MPNLKTFPFRKARRVTRQETEQFRKAIEKVSKTKRAARGRPAKNLEEKYMAISIRLHPQVLNWAKKRAKKTGVGYQTIINEALLKKI